MNDSNDMPSVLENQVEDFKGTVLRDTEVYLVEDNRFLSSMVTSKTTLHPGHHTKGHKHPQEEVYMFMSGHGALESDHGKVDVKPGSIVQIKGDTYHRVYNLGEDDLVFVAIFESYERDA